MYQSKLSTLTTQTQTLVDRFDIFTGMQTLSNAGENKAREQDSTALFEERHLRKCELHLCQRNRQRDTVRTGYAGSSSHHIY